MNLKKFFKLVYKKNKHTFLKLKHVFFKPAYPVNSDGKVLLHLGCGEINIPGFINIDSRPFPHIHHIHSVQKLSFLKNDFADLIYCSHILEHIPMREIKGILIEWRRVIKKGGILRIGVPDFDTILNIYEDNGRLIDNIWMPLMGGQDYPENFHYSVFNKKYLTQLLQECGFNNIREWNADQVGFNSFRDWTSADFYVGNKNYPISLNLECIK